MKISTKIANKIAEIRLQPESVRLRYVWGSVIFCMLIIVAIWIFSLSVMFRSQKNNAAPENSDTGNIAKQLQDLKQQAPSLKNYTEQSLTTNSEGVQLAPQQNSSDFQYPINNNEEVPQASNYSDLPTAAPAQ